MANRIKRIYDISPRDAADKWALGLAFFLGAGGAFALKHLGAPPLLVMFWSASILLAYVAVAWLLKRLQIEAETIGDNCYYLGFVFTLASLAGTLHLLGWTEGKADAIRDVISGFGVALTSTILGIVLRVLLIRMRPDIVARDREARRELHFAVRDFRVNLSASLTDLKHFSVETVQVLSEQREEIRAATRETIKALTASIEEQTKMAGDALTAAADKTAKAITGALTNAASSHEEIRVTTRETTKALTASVEEQTKMAGDALTAAADKTAKAITDALTKAAASHEEFIAQVAGMREAVADLARRESEILKTLVEDSTSVSRESDKMQSALARLAERLEAVSANLDAAASRVSGELEPAANTMVSAVLDAGEAIRKMTAQGARRAPFWRRLLPPWRRPR